MKEIFNFSGDNNYNLSSGTQMDTTKLSVLCL